MIGGRAPKYEWRPNPDGQSRSIEEAREIARRWGVAIPEYVSFAIDKYDWLDADTTAKTTTFKEPAGTMIYWSMLFHNQTGKIPFLIRKNVLRSDEAIVAVIGHEMYELEELRKAIWEKWRGDRTLAGRGASRQCGQFSLARLGLRGRVGGQNERRRVMVNELIEMYREGAITGYQVMIDCLHMLDPDNRTSYSAISPRRYWMRC